MNKKFRLLALLLVFAMVLSACAPAAPKQDGGDKPTDTQQGQEQKQDGGEEKKNDSEAMAKEMDSKEFTIAQNEGSALAAGEGVLKMALVSANPFKGVFSAQLYQGNDDSSIMNGTMWGSTLSDEEFKMGKGGPVEMEFDREKKTATIKINPKYTWNDGTPVTAKDYMYAYEVVGHGDYTGIRFGDDYKNVIGMEEYHWGTMSEETLNKLKEASEDFKMPEDITPAKEISGLKMIDDQTLEVSFKTFGVDILWGSGIPFEPMPHHYLKDIEIAKLAESDEIRLKPLSPGPYYINRVVPGESIEFKANPHYYKGEAKIPTAILNVLSPDKLVESMKAGEYDVYINVPAAKYEDIKDLPNFDVLTRTDYAYSYIGFKLGKWDAQNKTNIYDPNSKMADLNLRSAMELAIDANAIGEQYYGGLRYRGATIIPTLFKSFHDPSLQAIPYDLEKAKMILDEAGYKDTDNDGKREKPDGSKLTINVAMMDGSAADKEISEYYMQQWKEIGLDVQYTEGRLLEFNHFYDLVGADNENIDVYFGAWSTGTNPEPYGLYGKDAVWNFSRFVDDELEAALKKVTSEESFDDAFRVQAYKDVQRIIYEKKPISILYYRMAIRPVNKRVKLYDWSYTSTQTLNELELLAPEPVKAQ